jgi:hypothetical protein
MYTTLNVTGDIVFGFLFGLGFAIAQTVWTLIGNAIQRITHRPAAPPPAQ